MPGPRSITSQHGGHDHAKVLCMALVTHWVPYECGSSFSFCSPVQFSHSVVSDSLRPHGLQPARLPCLSLTPRAYSNSCVSCRSSHLILCHRFSSGLQSFPASGSFLMSRFFTSGGKVLDLLTPVNNHVAHQERMEGLLHLLW